MTTYSRDYLTLTALCVFLFFLLTTVTATARTDKNADETAGHLYLVSTGTGEPDNMTLRAHGILTRADIYFAMRPEAARKMYADFIGDKPVYEAGHGLFTPHLRHGAKEKQVLLENNARTVIRDAVSGGKTVAVLCSGDPTIFCPHTGFMTEFKDLAPVMIPGISSFNAANAALGRSITSGRTSRSVILTAAMGAGGKYKGTDSLAKLAESRSTMVFFTMGSRLSDVVDELKTQYPGDTPIAIVFHAGSRKNENIVTATLDTIGERVGSGKLPFEHLIYVGDFLR